MRLWAWLLATAVAAVVVAGGGADAAERDRRQAASDHVVVLEDVNLMAKANRLEGQHGFRTTGRFAVRWLRGFTARLTPAEVLSLATDREVRAVRESPASYLVSLRDVPPPDADAFIDQIAARVQFTATPRFRSRALVGFVASLSAPQLTKLESEGSVGEVDVLPTSLIVTLDRSMSRGATAQKSEELIAALGLNVRFRLSDGFSAGGVSVGQVNGLLADPDVHRISFNPSAYCVLGCRPMRIRDDRRLRADLRAALRRARPRLRRQVLEGPIGRVYAAQFRDDDFAVASFRVGRRDVAAIYTRARPRRWRWSLDTNGVVCTAGPNALPEEVVYIWSLARSEQPRCYTVPGRAR